MNLITKNLTIGYAPPRKAPITIAQGLNVSLGAGELTCLIGRNGVGKSTLMRTLSGVQKPLAGSVLLGDTSIHQLSVGELAKHVAIVLTDPIAPSQMTGYDLVGLGRHPYTDWAGRLSDHDLEMVEWAIRAVDATHLAKLPITEMSDGSRQRLLIARALAQETDVILLDEPTAFLDVTSRAEMMSLLRHLAKSANRAILLSTHDLDLALRLGDMLWVMDDGAVHIGAPEDLALSGVLGRVFKSGRMRFNANTMRFEFVGDSRPIRVVGDGLIYDLTCHALVRAGYVIGEAGQTVTIREHGDTPIWQVDDRTFDSLYDLVRGIEK